MTLMSINVDLLLLTSHHVAAYHWYFANAWKGDQRITYLRQSRICQHKYRKVRSIKESSWSYSRSAMCMLIPSQDISYSSMARYGEYAYTLSPTKRPITGRIPYPWLFSAHKCVHRRKMYMSRLSDAYNVALIIPTGIGARIGGYAGDALPIARLLSSFVGDKGYLITHPNVMNGAMMYYPMKNVLYVEGLALDEFADGKLTLEPVLKGSQQVGLLLDSGMEKDLQIRHIQVADAARATLGMRIGPVVITSRPVNVSIEVAPSGASWGSIQDKETFIEGARKLIDQGCTAIAVVVRFPEDDEIEATSDLKSAALFEAYRQGEGVDAIAGVEAIISHIITKEFTIPCAHAPAFAPMDPDENVSPKAAAEELGYTFLPCVLANLHKAPNLIPIDDTRHDTNRERIYSSDVDAVVVPVDALGGPAVLSFISQGKLVIAVEENITSMDVTKEELFPSTETMSQERGPNGTSGISQFSRQIIRVRSYAEAVGILTAHREGLLLESITSHVDPLHLL